MLRLFPIGVFAVFCIAVSTMPRPIASAGPAETLLYSFQGQSDGAVPDGGLVADRNGDLYGTTYGGGDSLPVGTVFELTPNGTQYRYQLIHDFNGPDGAFPSSDLLLDKGVLYGTTISGGQYSLGNVFSLTPSASGYTLTVLHSFAGGSDGEIVYSGLLRINGKLFGTTHDGGKAGAGIVFELTPSGSTYRERILHSFRGGSDGGHPFAGLIADANGDLFGTTSGCCTEGQSNGTVFELVPGFTHYSEVVLYRFKGGLDGANPRSVLVADQNGVLYGTTYDGGATGFGTVFKLTPSSASGYTETVLHTFQGGDDGGNPAAGLRYGPSGVLYGTTSSQENGTVYEIAPGGTGYAVVYDFQSTKDCRHPEDALLVDGRGTLYGTASAGGAFDEGSVFKLVP